MEWRVLAGRVILALSRTRGQRGTEQRRSSVSVALSTAEPPQPGRSGLNNTSHLNQESTSLRRASAWLNGKLSGWRGPSAGRDRFKTFSPTPDLRANDGTNPLGSGPFAGRDGNGTCTWVACIVVNSVSELNAGLRQTPAFYPYTAFVPLRHQSCKCIRERPSHT